MQRSRLRCDGAYARGPIIVRSKYAACCCCGCCHVDVISLSLSLSLIWCLVRSDSVLAGRIGVAGPSSLRRFSLGENYRRLGYACMSLRIITPQHTTYLLFPARTSDRTFTFLVGFTQNSVPAASMFFFQCYQYTLLCMCFRLYEMSVRTIFIAHRDIQMQHVRDLSVLCIVQWMKYANEFIRNSGACSSFAHPTPAATLLQPADLLGEILFLYFINNDVY